MKQVINGDYRQGVKAALKAVGVVKGAGFDYSSLRMAYTGEQKREYQRKWLANRRSKAFESLGGQCVKCKTTETLELDHIDPNQKIDHKIWSWSWDRINEEIAKCQLLCNKCHKAKTKEQAYRRFCPKGHDTEIVGRKPGSNGCRECHRECDRARRQKV